MNAWSSLPKRKDEAVISESASIVGSDIAPYCTWGTPDTNEAKFASLRGWEIALLASSINESSGNAVEKAPDPLRPSKEGSKPAEASRLTTGPKKRELGPCSRVDESTVPSLCPSSVVYMQSRPRARHFEHGWRKSHLTLRLVQV